MAAPAALSRCGVGELLVVYHSLAGAEHLAGKRGLPRGLGLDAVLTAYARLAPSLGVGPAEDRVVRGC
eukprot:COSAG04_NODE_4178_length_2252_cov_2.780307_2_plen_67_part_01